jgi:hypothetical protein
MKTIDPGCKRSLGAAYPVQPGRIDKVWRAPTDQPCEQIAQGIGRSERICSQPSAHDFRGDDIRGTSRPGVVRELEDGNERCQDRSLLGRGDTCTARDGRDQLGDPAYRGSGDNDGPAAGQTTHRKHARQAAQDADGGSHDGILKGLGDPALLQEIGLIRDQKPDAGSRLAADHAVTKERAAQVRAYRFSQHICCCMRGAANL